MSIDPKDYASSLTRNVLGEAHAAETLRQAAQEPSLSASLERAYVQLALCQWQLECARIALARAKALQASQPLPPQTVSAINLPHHAPLFLETLRATVAGLEAWLASETCQALRQQYPTPVPLRRDDR
jgi:hypothetical protein